MLIYKATNTLDGYLPSLDYTQDKADAEIMVVGGKAIHLDEFPKLRGIFKTGIGTDNLPFEEAQKRNIQIALPASSTIDVILEETAAFTCHLILQAAYAAVGDWDQWLKVDRPALFSRSLLVIGNGRIGKRVVAKMCPFMNVDTFDSAQDVPEVFESKVRSSDVIALLVPLTDETKGFFDKEKLGWMKDGAALVNTSRGPVIDEDALYTELSAGRLRAAIDVFWQEPYQGKLNKLPSDRFMRTPHVASTCKEFIEGTANDFLSFMKELGDLS